MFSLSDRFGFNVLGLCVATLGASLPFAAVAQTQPPADPVIAVGVIDVGTNAPVNVVGGFNFVLGNQDLSDLSGNDHGTTVSLIIDEAAPGIPQFQYIAANGQFESSPGITDAAIITAAANPDVRTIAVTSGVVFAPSSVMADASNAGKFIAIRAGNNVNDNPNVLSIASFQLPGVVIVAGADGAGGVAGISSNNCGITAPRCVRTVATTDFSSIQGTSFAAARLAGIAAEVLRSAPFLTAEEVAQVIFAAAQDLGDPGVDTVYGNGFVADAAQVINSPAGLPEIPTGDGGGGGDGGGVLVLAGVGLAAAAGAAILMKGEDGKLKRTLVLDSFGRPFEVDLTELATIVDSRPSINEFLDSLDERYGSENLYFGRGSALSVAYSTRDEDPFDIDRHLALAGDPVFADSDLDWAFSFRSLNPEGFNYAFNHNLDPAFDYGAFAHLNGLERGGRIAFLSGQNFSSPLLGFTASADSAALGFSASNGFDFKFGLVNTDEGTEYGRESVAAVFEGSYEFDDRGMISAQFGRLKEAGSLFGGSSGGAFGVETTETYALSISGSLHLNDRVSIIGNYGFGYTEVDDAERSLLHDFSSLRSDWFGFGLIANRVFNRRDQFGVAMSQPLRVIDGNVDRDVPYARDLDGNIYKNTDRINLQPDGTEYTLESFYRYRLTQRASLAAHLMLQHEPNHVAGAGMDVTVLGSLRMGF